MKDRRRAGLGAIRGPVILITVGVLFALNNFTPYGFGETWPVLIIVIGLLSLLGRAVAPPPQPGPPNFQPPVYTPPYQPPQTGYRKTPYAQPNYPQAGPNDPNNTPGGSA